MFTHLSAPPTVSTQGLTLLDSAVSPRAEDQRQRMSIKWVFGDDTSNSWHTVKDLAVRMLFSPWLFCFPLVSFVLVTAWKAATRMEDRDIEWTLRTNKSRIFCTYLMSYFNVGKERGPHTETSFYSPATECANASADGLLRVYNTLESNAL